jgi:hypothetical protein
MSESKSRIVEDPPSSPRFELPRLQIIHLMMWMAATAVAFLPYRVQRASLERTNSTSVQVQLRETPGALVMTVGYGVLQGAFLFVTAAVLWWRRRGADVRLQPGYCFALRGTVFWAASVIVWAFLSLNDGRPSTWFALLSILYLGASLGFFVWFLRLARRKDSTPGWRRAFAVAAIAPAVGWELMTALGVIAARTPTSFITVMALTQAPLAAIVALALVAAIRADRRGGIVRHWSHEIGVWARVVEAAGMSLNYLMIWLTA